MAYLCFLSPDIIWWNKR